MALFETLRHKRALARYAGNHEMQTPSGYCWLSPRFGPREGHLLEQVQRSAGLNPTGRIDGPTVETLHPGSPLEKRIVRIARAELHEQQADQPYRWAGSSSPNRRRQETTSDWPYRHSELPRNGQSESCRCWPESSDWGQEARDYVATQEINNAAALSVAFCRFALMKAGFASTETDEAESAGDWISLARDHRHPRVVPVAWNEAKGGDLLAFRWGGGEGEADHLAVSLRYRRYFHDTATTSGTPHLPDRPGFGALVALPLYTWSVQQVIRILETPGRGHS